MINKQILKLREELNNSIINGEKYEIIYKLSVELDELITEYYKECIFSKNREETKEKSNKIVIRI